MGTCFHEFTVTNVILTYTIPKPFSINQSIYFICVEFITGPDGPPGKDGPRGTYKYQNDACINGMCVTLSYRYIGNRRGLEHMVLVLINTCAISSCHHLRCEFEFCPGEVSSILHYVVNFVSDLWQFGGFLHL